MKCSSSKVLVLLLFWNLFWLPVSREVKICINSRCSYWYFSYGYSLHKIVDMLHYNVHVPRTVQLFVPYVFHIMMVQWFWVCWRGLQHGFHEASLRLISFRLVIQSVFNVFHLHRPKNSNSSWRSQKICLLLIALKCCSSS